MARQANRLTALKVKSLEKPGRYADGHNLWLQISENGGKSWVLRYMLDGKARHMGLGPLHTVTLAEAREKAREQRKLLLNGTDPLQLKQEKIGCFAL
jgi:Arm DNA-binding domain